MAVGMERSSGPIYLDHAAASPLRETAREALLRAYTEAPANPSSISQVGRDAARVLRTAREGLAVVLGVPADRILFTSGGTEANGLAVLGALSPETTGHVVTSAIEHPSVLGSVALLERRGFAVTRVRPEPDGRVDPDRFAAAVQPDTRLACLMHVNNELGTIQPVAEALDAVRDRAPRCLTLVDAVQSFTRHPLDLEAWQADFVSLSGHKIGGPRGIGALVALRRRPQALLGGGEQEWGARPGTENVPGAAGFAAAAEEAEADRTERHARAQAFHDALVERLTETVPRARILGEAAHRSPFILCVTVDRLPSEALLRGIEEHGVVVSAGAACHARSQKQSHVMQALGLPSTTGTARISLGDETRLEQVEAVVTAIASTVKRYALP